MNLTNKTYIGSNDRASLIDLQLPDSFNGKLIVFAHGYKGYKDWGAWNLLQQYFVSKNYGFCKFNFSHNGGTAANGIDFPDLDAFSRNTFSKEVFDLQQVLNFLEKKLDTFPEIHLIGHSLGGGIVLLNARDHRVKSIITLASVSSIAKRFSDQKMMDEWKLKGVRYVENQSTKQEMPHLYDQAIDFLENKESLNIQSACKSFQKPCLIIHGDQDETVPISEGYDIAKWTHSTLQVVLGGNHVFGVSHPWDQDRLPSDLEKVCVMIDSFLTNN